MDRNEAWNKFTETGAVADYLQFKQAQNKTAEAEHEDEHRRAGSQNDGHGRA